MTVSDGSGPGSGLPVARNASSSRASLEARQRSQLGSVAIVHDYLNQRGGAERVVLEMADMLPEAPIYTSLYRPESTFPEFRDRTVRTSPLNHLPVDASFRNLFFLYPAAFRAFGTLSEDVVISSSSGWAHSVRAAPDSFHVVYCYTPARWLYGHGHLGASRRNKALQPAIGLVRRWDRTAARRADLYIAISEFVRERIRQRYGFDAPVIYPPVDVDRFRPSQRGERLLVVSRLLPYKRVDVIVDAATQAGIGLDVVGTGPALDNLKRRAGPTVAFHGRLEDTEVTKLMEGCRALCLPGQEDFGITLVEANAAGKPVVAFGAGGALETLEDGVSGCYFRHHTPDDVLAAVTACDNIGTSPEVIAGMARRFSSETFQSHMLEMLDSGAQAFRAKRV